MREDITYDSLLRLRTEARIVYAKASGHPPVVHGMSPGLVVVRTGVSPSSTILGTYPHKHWRPGIVRIKERN